MFFVETQNECVRNAQVSWKRKQETKQEKKIATRKGKENTIIIVADHIN